MTNRLGAAMLLLALCCPLALYAKPKVKMFNNSPQEVFDAALRTARERHVITYTDEAHLMFTFETGTSVLSYGFVANASVEAEADGKAKLLINVQKKNAGKNFSISFGAGDRMADKFFQQVEEELAREPKQKTEAHSEAPHVNLPPNPAGATVNAETGTVVVNSNPEGADILVDGAFAGNAPATLKLSAGKHAIVVIQKGHKQWTRELSVLSGSEVRLNAALEKE